MAYKTPGVYVEEKSIFPPSVAQVATAITAFIGYTEKATERTPNDLHNVPKRISDWLEFERLFGYSPPLNITSVRINANNALADGVIQPRFYLYDSLRLFFDNGGSVCYIVSVGQWGNLPSVSVQQSALKAGLAALEKFDEPTLILFPDAVLLSSGLQDIQKAALVQCNKLKDRFAIFDLKEQSTPTDLASLGVDDFRNHIGTENLKYGAAYTPYLHTSLKKTIRYRDIYQIITRAGAAINLGTLTKNRDVQTKISDLETAIRDVKTINVAVSGFLSSFFSTSTPQPTTLSEGYQVLDARFKKASNDSERHTRYANIFDFLYRIIVVFDDLRFTTPVGGTNLLNTLTSLTSTAIKLYGQLIAMDRGADSIWSSKYNCYAKTDNTGALTSANWRGWNPSDVTTLPSPDTTHFGSSGSVAERLRNGLSTLNQIFEQLNAMMVEISTSSNSIENNCNKWLYDHYPTFKALIDDLNNTMTTLPPSGAIAGVYAQVDANRGVWKAPANVSLNSVVGLTYNTIETE